MKIATLIFSIMILSGCAAESRHKYSAYSPYVRTYQNLDVPAFSSIAELHKDADGFYHFAGLWFNGKLDNGAPDGVGLCIDKPSSGSSTFFSTFDMYFPPQKNRHPCAFYKGKRVDPARTKNATLASREQLQSDREEKAEGDRNAAEIEAFNSSGRDSSSQEMANKLAAYQQVYQPNTLMQFQDKIRNDLQANQQQAGRSRTEHPSLPDNNAYTSPNAGNSNSSSTESESNTGAADSATASSTLVLGSGHTAHKTEPSSSDFKSAYPNDMNAERARCDKSAREHNAQRVQAAKAHAGKVIAYAWDETVCVFISALSPLVSENQADGMSASAQSNTCRILNERIADLAGGILGRSMRAYADINKGSFERSHWPNEGCGCQYDFRRELKGENGNAACSYLSEFTLHHPSM